MLATLPPALSIPLLVLPQVVLPAHPVPDSSRASASDAVLRIEGLVERPVALSSADLADLPRLPLTDDFRCTEGWSVPNLRWEGVRLSDVLALARPRPEARYVRVGADEYVVPLALDQAGLALLCDRLDGQPLSLAHGAPWRLRGRARVSACRA